MPRIDRAHRVIPASVDEVYAALIDPAALMVWLPPEGMSGRFERFDARPGGSYQLVLTYDDPSHSPGKTGDGSDVVESRFIELVPNVRVVQAVDFESDDPAFAGTMTMTWSVAPVDEGTHVEIDAENVPDGISSDDHIAGLTSSLAKLAAYFEA